MGQINIVAFAQGLLVESQNVYKATAIVTKELEKQGFSAEKLTFWNDTQELIQEAVVANFDATGMSVFLAGNIESYKEILVTLTDLLQFTVESQEIDLATEKISLDIPKGAKLMLSPSEMFPGLLMQTVASCVLVLPAWQEDLGGMLKACPIPFLPTVSQVASLRLYFCPIPDTLLEEGINAVLHKEPKVSIQFWHDMGILQLLISTLPGEFIPNMRLCHDIANHFRHIFCNYYIPNDEGYIEDALQNLFVEKGLTLSLAESCSGGKLARLLTRHSGSSAYFLGSIIAYNESAKERLLQIPAKLLKDKGAVCEEVAAAMAQGALNQFGSDYAIALTGIAGPTGGSVEVPVGTVCACICSENGETHSWTMRLNGGRHRIVHTAGNLLLCTLWQRIAFDQS